MKMRKFHQSVILHVQSQQSRKRLRSIEFQRSREMHHMRTVLCRLECVVDNLNFGVSIFRLGILYHFYLLNGGDFELFFVAKWGRKSVQPLGDGGDDVDEVEEIAAENEKIGLIFERKRGARVLGERLLRLEPLVFVKIEEADARARDSSANDFPEIHNKADNRLVFVFTCLSQNWSKLHAHSLFSEKARPGQCTGRRSAPFCAVWRAREN